MLKLEAVAVVKTVVEPVPVVFNPTSTLFPPAFALVIVRVYGGPELTVTLMPNPNRFDVVPVPETC